MKWKIEYTLVAVMVIFLGAVIGPLAYSVMHPAPKAETGWQVLVSPETGRCYEVVSVPRAADLVYPIADEYCDATNLTKK